MLWEVEPKVRSEVFGQLHPPSFIGQKKTGHIKDEVELRGRRGLSLALMQERNLRGEKTVVEVQSRDKKRDP